MSKFDPTKPVQTRDGRKARIIATDAVDPIYPIVALVTQKAGEERPERYTSTGSYYSDGDILRPADLVNVPEKHVRWVNIYRGGGVDAVGKVADCDDPDTAKAAAQADYEARILAALDPAPTPDATPDQPRRVTVEDDAFLELIADGMAEADMAIRKFPQPNYVISKIAEEAGEVVKAAIHHAENRETAENVLGEMQQLIAMLYRLCVEGDQVHGMAPLIPREAKG